MVRLKNIRISGSLMECDIYPEGSTQAGHVLVDAKSGELKEYTLPDGYEWCENHVSHAKQKLIEMFVFGNIPAEKLVMWY